MPITLKKPQAVSNKNNTSGYSTEINTNQPTPDTDKLVTTPIPFIDRLSVVVKVPHALDGYDIHSSIWSMTQTATKGGVIKELTKAEGLEDQCFVAVSQKPGGYRKAWRIILPSVVKPKFWPHLSYAYQDHMATSLRIDFIPHDIGPDGMAELHSILSTIVPNGWHYFVSHGRITRIDISIDLPTLTMADFHLLPRQGATTKVWRSNGVLETFQHGKTRGNHTVIYDRVAKRMKNGTWAPDKVGVRVERRLVKAKIDLNKLHLLPCPYKDFCLTKRVPPPPGPVMKPYVWALFLNAAETIGLPAALALLPEDVRTALRKHLVQHVAPWFDVEIMWDGWARPAPAGRHRRCGECPSRAGGS